MDLSAFHFLRPLWLAAIVPAILLWIGLRRAEGGSGQWTQHCDAHLLPHLLVAAGAKRARAPLMLLLLAWTIAAIAAAGPTWTQLPQPVFRTDATRVIVLDLSRSMNAADITPSRLARAKFKVLDLLRATRDGQTAMLVFAGESYVLAPLTDDAETIASLVPVLGTELMPAQGSRVESGLYGALNLLNQSGIPGAAVVLITDGVESLEAAQDAAAKLHSAGHRLSVLMAGTEEGAPIPLNNGGFLKDDGGAIVIAQVHKDQLKSIAAEGGGIFEEISVDNSDVNSLLAAIDKPADALRQAEQQVRIADSWRDEGPWLVLLLLPLAALAFRRGTIAAFALAAIIPLPKPAMAFEPQSVWSRADQQAAAELERGRVSEAAQLFEDPAWKGTAYYQAGDFPAAEQAFQTLDNAEGRYNLGNALAQQGKFEEALAAYQDALSRDPAHADALHNKELVEQFLKSRSGEPESGSKNTGNERSSQSSGKGNSPSASETSDAQGAPSDDRNDGEASDDSSAQNESAGSRQKSAKPQTHSAKSEQDQGQISPQQQSANDGRAQDPQQQASARQTGSGQSTETTENRGQGAEQTAGNAAEQKRTSSQSLKDIESQQAMEQWLRQIPDDPGGLLRRKFAREHQRLNAPRGAQERNGKW